MFRVIEDIYVDIHIYKAASFQRKGKLDKIILKSIINI